MNITELRRRKNNAIKKRNAAQRVGPYRNQLLKRAAHKFNKAAVVRNRTNNVRKAARAKTNNLFRAKINKKLKQIKENRLRPANNNNNNKKKAEKRTTSFFGLF